jgi:hypothetical protein
VGERANSWAFRSLCGWELLPLLPSQTRRKISPFLHQRRGPCRLVHNRCYLECGTTTLFTSGLAALPTVVKDTCPPKGEARACSHRARAEYFHAHSLDGVVGLSHLIISSAAVHSQPTGTTPASKPGNLQDTAPSNAPSLLADPAHPFEAQTPSSGC